VANGSRAPTRSRMPPNPRSAVVSLATDAFSASLARLDRSLDRVGFGGTRALWWPGMLPQGCPSHEDVPFAFKPFCLAEAAKAGASRLLWLDSTCMALLPLDVLFAEIEQSGYLLFRNGSRRVGEWASDAALELFGLARDDAMELPEVNAAAIGLDVGDPVAAEFLRRWLHTARASSAFRGASSNDSGAVSSDPRVQGHRHDQTVAGILAHELGMQPNGTGFRPFRRRRSPVPPSTIVVNCRPAARLGRPTLAAARLAGRAKAKVGLAAQ
jgi:hypothetical protein